MIFSRAVALELCALNEAAYDLATTGHCALPDGFTPAIPIRLPAASRPFLLRNDPLDIFGYATSKDRVITVVFRGTEITSGIDCLQEWAEDALALPTIPFGTGSVHFGFYAAWIALRVSTAAAILDAAWISRYVSTGATIRGLGLTSGENLRITGHSLGAAIATLCWSDFATTAYIDDDQHNQCFVDGDLMTFNGPRVGDAAFAKTLWDGQTIRVINHHDVVPDLPTDPPFRHGGQVRCVQGPWELLDPKVAHRLASDAIGINLLQEAPC